MTILMSAVLTLTALLPLAPSYIAHHLPDLFEVFSRLATWRSANHPTGKHICIHNSIVLQMLMTVIIKRLCMLTC